MAYIDALTGIGNRLALRRDYDSYQGHEVTVVMLDLNDFKLINDTRGHEEGDRILQEIGKLLSDTFGKDNCYRYGGDEFLVILQNRDLHHYDELIQQLCRDCDEEMLMAGEQRIPVSIAYGSAVYDPLIDNSFMDVFNRADDAMYKQKRKMKECAGG
jgi:diguanylate cyclase (GGDEF)-like protein